MAAPNDYPVPEQQPAYRDPLSYDYNQASRDSVYAREWRGAVEFAVGRDITNAFDSHQSAVDANTQDTDPGTERLALKSPDVLATHIPGSLELTRHTKMGTGEQITTISWTAKRDPGVHWIYTSTPGRPGQLLPAIKDPDSGVFNPKAPPGDPRKHDPTLDKEVAFGAQLLPTGIRQAHPGFRLWRKR